MACSPSKACSVASANSWKGEEGCKCDDRAPRSYTPVGQGREVGRGPTWEISSVSSRKREVMTCCVRLQSSTTRTRADFYRKRPVQRWGSRMSHSGTSAVPGTGGTGSGSRAEARKSGSTRSDMSISGGLFRPRAWVAKLPWRPNRSAWVMGGGWWGLVLKAHALSGLAANLAVRPLVELSDKGVLAQRLLDRVGDAVGMPAVFQPSCAGHGYDGSLRVGALGSACQRYPGWASALKLGRVGEASKSRQGT